METNAFIRVANGSEDSGWDIVKVTIDNQDIEIPHLSQASSVAFPNEVFRFSYTYQQTSKPISSVTIDLGDSLRRVSVNGESADKVEALSKLLEKDFRRYTKPVGGVQFRRVTGVCLSMLFLTSLMISATYYWKNRNRSTLGILICSAVGFLLVLLVPWNRFVPGFVLYQRYSPFFLIRHAPEIFLLCLVAALLGIPLSYFLLREKR
jgi:lipopolysaccharide export LptBFGC system permease protein LptF